MHAAQGGMLPSIDVSRLLSDRARRSLVYTVLVSNDEEDGNATLAWFSALQFYEKLDSLTSNLFRAMYVLI